MPAIKISPVDDLYQLIEAYARQHNIKVATAATVLLAQALGYTEAPVAPHGGDRTTLMQCGWCGHRQKVYTWQDECRNCGECEFVNIK